MSAMVLCVRDYIKILKRVYYIIYIIILYFWQKRELMVTDVKTY